MTTFQEKAKRALVTGKKRARKQAGLSSNGEKPIETTGELVEDRTAQRVNESAQREVRRARMGFYSMRDR